jgi:hypothetical protein
LEPIAVSKLLTVLLPSAAIPLAVLAMPVLLLKSAFGLRRRNPRL